MIASGEPSELVLMPLLRSCGVTLPSKSENDSCCPSTGPSKIIFTIILSVDVITIRSSPES